MQNRIVRVEYADQTIVVRGREVLASVHAFVVRASQRAAARKGGANRFEYGHYFAAPNLPVAFLLATMLWLLGPAAAPNQLHHTYLSGVRGRSSRPSTCSVWSSLAPCWTPGQVGFPVGYGIIFVWLRSASAQLGTTNPPPLNP